MKIKNYLLSFATMALIVGVGTAQTEQQRQKITQDYDKQELRNLSQSYSKIYNKQRQRALDYAKANDLPMVVENENGEKSYLIRMDDLGNLIYYKNNSEAGATTIGVDRVWSEGNMGLQLEGEGLLGGVWDGGIARETHELLEGQVTIGDSSAEYDNHGTHVTGIMVGKALSGGLGSNARGMANKANAISYDWQNDIAEMTGEAADGLLVSNHSYGISLSQLPDPGMYAGRYDDVSKSIDNMMFNASKYTIIVAAGNDRGYNNPNPGDNGYNLLGGQMSTAKNAIVVAAVDEVEEYNGPNSVEMAPFSSWGPTADNRVKPDISAQGMFVLSSYAFNTSTGAPSDIAYSSESGTSMASPSVAGSVLLIQELAADLNDGEFLPSSMIKALMIGTARKADNELGPNPRYGWGLLAVDKIAELMVDAYNNDGNSYYIQRKLKAGSTPSYSKNITASGDELKVTIAWTDPAGSIQGIDDDSPRLMNDLDLRITDSQGNEFFPWRLSSDGYDQPALQDGDNDVDNVEQVLISNPEPGEEYTIEVTYKDYLVTGKQDFSMVVMGSETLGVENHKLSGFSIYPNPAKDHVNLTLEKSGDQVEVEVFDINGRKVLNNKFNGNSNFNERLDVSRLNSGVYFVEIFTNGKKATEKLIIN